MSSLNAPARQLLYAAHIADSDDPRLVEAEWARRCGWSEGVWYGDACGCSDDRCIGYHHSSDEPCGCLPVLLSYLAPGEPLSGEWGGAKVVEP